TVKIAHEIGHCVTDSFYTQTDDKRKRYRCEKKADEWAITKIVPEETFVRALKEGCREPWEFAEEFGVTEDFAQKVMNYYAKKLNHTV
ncbi:MAG: ImmA/IrrE family metallo-endopeptidase, partial [Clostridia bacterium]|nr:ImmA/IrrE family metallo-endopeptidase [Clostridia bacterium]